MCGSARHKHLFSTAPTRDTPTLPDLARRSAGPRLGRTFLAGHWGPVCAVHSEGSTYALRHPAMVLEVQARPHDVTPLGSNRFRSRW